MVNINFGTVRGNRPSQTGDVTHHYQPVRRQNKPLGLGGGIIFALVGLGMLVGGGFLFKSSADLAKNGVMVTGTVVRIDSRIDDGDGGTMYRPVVSYQTQEGEQRQYASSVWSSSVKYDVNDQAPIIYDPNNTGRVSIGDTSSQWGAPVILLGMGVIFFLLGLVAVVRRPKPAAAEPTSFTPASGPPDDYGSPPQQPPPQQPPAQPPTVGGTSGNL